MGIETIRKEIDDALGQFGLTEDETAVYKASLELGSRPASVLAEKSGLKRAHTYNILGKLIEKGIVQEFTKNSIRQFVCSPPEGLISVLEKRQLDLAQQKENFRSIVPLLERLQNPINQKPRVRFYHGADGVRQVWDDTLQVEDKKILGLIDFEYTTTLKDYDLNIWMQDYITRRAAKDIWYYGILNQSPASDKAVATQHNEKRKVKMITGLNLPVEVIIYGNKVGLFSIFEEESAIVIEDKKTADTIRSCHQVAWNLLPEYTPREK